ncbi:MAG TPA: response regulator transcription factor [Micromonosporaceae bacterium]|nr:response regulator transcription factor [Micromonosporaceae bacterium]
MNGDIDVRGLSATAGQPALLVVEDDRELRELLTRMFQDAGYRVDTAADGQAGLHAALTRRYDTLIVDRGLPAIDGLDLTARLRRQGLDTPILILTAYGALADRVAGLDVGAEDYVVKPFEIEELMARVRALLRRRASGRASVAIGRGDLDLTTRVATRADGTHVELSGREATLLRVLASRPSRVFSRDDLREQVFDSAESDTIVDTYVHYLRRKLGDAVVRTVRGSGYRIGEM